MLTVATRPILRYPVSIINDFTMKPSKRDLITYGAVALIIIIAVVGGVLTRSKNTASSTTDDNTNTVAPAVPKNPIALKDVCATCTALAGDAEGTVIIDPSTGTTESTIAKDADASFATLQSRSLAPSGTSEIVITDDYQRIYRITFPLGAPQLLYTAGTGESLNFVAWSPDEKTAVFGVGVTSDTNSSASDVLPTIVYTADLTAGTATKTFSASSVSGTALENTVPIAVTNGGARTIVATVDANNEVTFHYWDKGAKFLKEVPVSITVDSFFAQTGGASDRLLWAETDGLHAALLKDFTEKTFEVSTWSDVPFGSPSPDGTKVVYLKANDAADAGIPTLLDLNTGVETALTADTVTDSYGLSGSFWTPDSSWFVFTDFTAATPLSRSLNVTLTDQKIRDISDSALPAASQMYAFLKKA